MYSNAANDPADPAAIPDDLIRSAPGDGRRRTTALVIGSALLSALALPTSTSTTPAHAL